MKKTILSLVLSLWRFLLFAQQEQETVEVVKKSISLEDILYGILSVLVVLAIVGVVATIFIHMIRELFFRKKLVPLDLETLRQVRLDDDRPAEMTEDERERAIQLLQNIDTYKVHFTDDKGDECALPTKGKQVKAITRILAEVAEIVPTDEDMIVYYNNQVEIINEACRREFAGSKTYIIVSAVIMLGLGWLANAFWIALSNVLVGSLIYIAGSMKPIFMFWRSEINGTAGGSSFLTGMIGGVFGAVATANTYKTVTRWSDGTTTTDTDDSETWISLGFAFIVCVFLAWLMVVCGLINYLRYYVFYI